MQPHNFKKLMIAKIHTGARSIIQRELEILVSAEQGIPEQF